MIDLMIPGEHSVPILVTLAIKYLSDCPLALHQLENENIQLKEKKSKQGESKISDFCKMTFSVKMLGQNNNTEVFEWFKQYVVESNLGDNIGHEELCSLLSYGGRIKDEHVTLLINAGLLTRQLIDPNMYWFSIPNIGSILKEQAQQQPRVTKPVVKPQPARRTQSRLQKGVFDLLHHMHED
ncbi:hypothetical protein J5N97_022271 [Dioscorea zingiberensis]|uniref:Uncharacterized protein n=1 Tax=Dioscorea zingiberensis TaxID=325984 RepID=A0A9D5HAH3_9LILI|nr:hypothetical protein J5N97_022271 [Dioscorea zingiberensis]